MAASSSQPPVYDLDRHEKFSRILKLLKRGRANGHLYRYQEEIRGLFQGLGRYKADSFESLMNDPTVQDRTIESLERLISAWTLYNPTLSGQIDNIHTFEIYRNLAVELESLRQGHGNLAAIKKLGEYLNFSPEVIDKFASDQAFVTQTLQAMKARIDEWVESPAGQILELDPDLRLLFSYQNLVQTMYVGGSNLQLTILLSSPQGIRIAEFYAGLPPSDGTKEDFKRIYNERHYTQRCRDYGDADMCLRRGLIFGDEDLVDQILAGPEVEPMIESVFSLALGGQEGLIDRMVEHVYMKSEAVTPIQKANIGLVMYKSAVEGATRHGHLALVKKYMPIVQAMAKLRSSEEDLDMEEFYNSLSETAIYEGYLDIAKYIKEVYPEVSYEGLDGVSIEASGNVETVKWLVDNGHLGDIGDQNRLDIFFEAVRNGDVKMFDYILTQVPADTIAQDYNNLLNLAKLGGSRQIIRTIERYQSQ